MLDYKRRRSHSVELTNEEFGAIVNEFKEKISHILKSRKEFCLYDLVREDWTGLKVQQIYDKYRGKEELKEADNKAIMKKAALDAGYILKNILIDDKDHYYVCKRKRRNGKWNNYYHII